MISLLPEDRIDQLEFRKTWIKLEYLLHDAVNIDSQAQVGHFCIANER